jgi:hypothetical protein
MNIEMHPSVKKVVEFMQRELPSKELQGVAAAIAIIAPAIWGGHRYKKIKPMQWSRI